MAIISQEEIFNSKYRIHNRRIDFNGLIRFALSNMYLDEKYASLIIDTYKDAIYSLIMGSYDFDPEDDYDLKLRELTNKYFIALNDYLNSLNDPYQALNTIIHGTPKIIVDDAFKRYKDICQRLGEKIVTLKENSQLLIKYNFEYSFSMEIITKSLEIPNKSEVLYPAINGESVKDIYSLSDLETIVDDLLIEASILSKFKPNEIVKVLSDMTMNDLYKNVTAVVLYNYIFNSFFKDSESIVLSENMQQIVAEGIQNNYFNLNDVFDIIEGGSISFNDTEKKYIYDKFIPLFSKDIVEEKDIKQFIKINNSI